MMKSGNFKLDLSRLFSNDEIQKISHRYKTVTTKNGIKWAYNNFGVFYAQGKRGYRR